uniref:SCP domain-containing protein n=1 Tax=Strongyloides stercoralis TaxID=6248 RepID=A0A0K0EDY7_STRER
MKSSQNVRTIEYKIIRSGPKTEYEYKGQRYSDMNEVLNKIRTENPNSKLTFYQPSSHLSNPGISNQIGNPEQYSKNSPFVYNKPYYGNNNYDFNKPSYGSNPYGNSAYQPGSSYSSNSIYHPNSIHQPGNSIHHPNSIQRPGNSIQYPNSNNKPYNPNEIPNHIGPVNPSNGYKPYKPSEPVSSNEIYPWLDVKKYIDNNPFSAKIWRYVWDGCHYECFKRNNFLELKLRMLKESNQYRKYHKAGPLVEDPYLTQLAQAYAEKIARLGRLVHDSDRRFGENLGYSTVQIAYIIVKQWYDEVKFYKFGNNYPTSGAGHFSQLVWVSSSKVGCGVATSGSEVYVVCKYSPKGNISPLYGKNVLPR